MDANAIISKIKFIEGTDIETGLEYCASDEVIYVETLEDFLEDDRGNALQGAFESGDIDTYHINAHALKNLCYTLGLNALGDKAKELDDAAKANDFDYIKSHNEELYSMYIEVTSKLRTIIDES